MTQTIELQIPEELLRLVDERAQTAGLPREAYIRAVLSKDVSGELSLSAILAPFRDQVAGSGISDEELDSPRPAVSLTGSQVSVEAMSGDRPKVRAVFDCMQGRAVHQSRDRRERELPREVTRPRSLRQREINPNLRHHLDRIAVQKRRGVLPLLYRIHRRGDQHRVAAEHHETRNRAVLVNGGLEHYCALNALCLGLRRINGHHFHQQLGLLHITAHANTAPPLPHASCVVAHPRRGEGGGGAGARPPVSERCAMCGAHRGSERY